MSEEDKQWYLDHGYYLGFSECADVLPDNNE